MTSSEREKAHSRMRAKERYGINLGPNTRRDLVRQIQNNEAKFLLKKSNRLSAFAVRHDEEWLPVYYDTKRSEIATILPRNYLDKYKDRLE